MTDIFARAADIIETGGHCKFALEDYNGAHCARGALMVAAVGRVHRWFDGDPDVPEEIEASVQAGAKLVSAGVVELPSHGSRTDAHISVLVYWNNAPERTGADVVALFRELAAFSDNETCRCSSWGIGQCPRHAGPRAADIGEEEAVEIEFEPVPETAPVETPAEPVPA